MRGLGVGVGVGLGLGLGLGVGVGLGLGLGLGIGLGPGFHLWCEARSDPPIGNCLAWYAGWKSRLVPVARARAKEPEMGWDLESA